jgi:hypothetical protein
MGKWSKLKASLARFVEDPTWQARIDLEKENYLADNRTARCRHYAEAREEKKRLEERVLELNTSLEALSQLLVEDLEAELETKITNHLGTFSIKDDPYPVVQDRLAYLHWIREQELEDLLTVNYQTTAGQVKDRLEKGLTLPPGINVFMKSKIAYYANREGSGPLTKDPVATGFTGTLPG